MSIDLNDYRARKAAAMAYHPCVWTPDDAIATAQAFAAELEHAERGQLDEPKLSTRMFGRSRFRRAKIYDGLAVLLLLILSAALGCVAVLAATPAHADTGTRAFAWEVGPEICAYLDEHETFAGLLAAGQAVTEQGFTVEESGEVVAYSVTDVCPRHTDLLARFIVTFGPKQVA